MGIDGDRSWPAEGFSRRWPDLIEMGEATKARVASYWPEIEMPPSWLSE
jgi:4-hydroxy-3-polyprenylbenzoate decarboxylase